MNKKKKNSLGVLMIAIMLILCIAAGLYILKLTTNRAEEKKAAEAAKQAEQEAAELASEAEEASKAAEHSEHIYSNRGKSDDSLYTMAAYDSAVEAGAGTLVLPFVVSQDDTLFVANDDYANELTGYGGYFSGMTDGQIDNLETNAGTKVLKLSDVFDKYGKDMNYVIDLRYTSVRNLEALRRIIEKYDFEENVSVSSEYLGGLKSLESYLPDIPKIFRCVDGAGFNEAKNSDFVDTISVEKTLLSEDMCKDAHDHDKKFGAWVLNTEDEIKSAINMGADSYFTDETALAVSLEDNNRE